MTARLPDAAAKLAERYDAVRRHTVALAAPLSPEDCCVQSMPDASPTKWHLAHTTWFFESFVLAPATPRYRPWNDGYAFLFNSYYEAVGPRQPRPQRGLLTRPSLAEVLAYRAALDARLHGLLAGPLTQGQLGMIELGLQHEQQHQELILTDIKHLLSCNPLQPAYVEGACVREPAPPLRWLGVDGGLFDVGHDGRGFAFDNETPRHRVHLEPYELAQRPVTCGEYLAFIADGGYRTSSLWLAEGWDWVRSQRLQAPLYWTQRDGRWMEFTLHGPLPADADLPVCHLSYFEADAFARFAGARLPSEFEWEVACAQSAPSVAEQGPGGLHPCLAPEPAGGLIASGVWEWTRSSYAPYPGFRVADGAVGEYNGKFMVNQYVLRGASCVTPAGHSRPTYRNFFPAAARWQFSGVRLARDV